MTLLSFLNRARFCCVVSLVMSAASFANEPIRYLEEIVVSSKKVEQMLKDVPLAVSVLSQEQIEKAAAINIEDLQHQIAAVSFRKGNTTRNSAITIRGIGTVSFSIAAEPSVSTVVDGVVLARSGQAFADLYDLERIEVLRGPQGTLFGKNASAGVVNIVTRRPSYELDARVQASFFEDDERRIKAQVSGPINDDLRASLVVFDADFDGYIKNVANNDTINGYDRWGYRAMFEWDAPGDLSALFIVEKFKAKDECCADLEAISSGRNISAAAASTGTVVGGKANIELDQRRVDHDLVTTTLDKTEAISLQFDKGFMDDEYLLTSITGYRRWNNTEIREGDFTSRNGDANLSVNNAAVNFSTVGFQLHDVGAQKWSQFSQELRLAYQGSDDYEYQLGFFYFNVDSTRSFTRQASCQDTADNQDIVDLNPGLTCLATDIVAATADFDADIDNYAVFGEFTYNINDYWVLTVGGRYTNDEVEFSHRRINSDPFGRRGVGVRQAALNTDFANDTDQDNVSGKLSLQWYYSDTSIFYVTASTGYKGPGFNVFYNMAEQDTAPISEETSDSYEIGHKTTLSNLSLNFAIFRTEIDGFQANNFDTSGGTTITRLTNAGEVSTQGVEVDFSWLPIDNLTLYGSVAITKAEIEKFKCPVGTACSARSGQDIPFAPDKKYVISAQYYWPTDFAGVTFYASYSYTDEQFSNLPGNTGSFAPQDLLPDHEMLNASITLSSEDERYSVTLLAKNILDDEYASTYSGDGFRYQIPRDADRYVGVQAKVSLF